ncbi:MAG: cytidine deaminase [Acidobacteria bacterium]|nr:cytidine deaminase [Acidobacteriota bacterium]
MSDEALIALAGEARERAHAPYSKFEVGAALLTADGRVFSGCNIENSTYSLTVCAERVAIFKAVSEGAREIVKIAVVVDTENLTPPCGCCRQMIWEFAADETTVILANLSGDVSKCEIRELLPKAFDSSFLVGVG